jgi:hypothetical protein
VIPSIVQEEFIISFVNSITNLCSTDKNWNPTMAHEKKTKQSTETNGGRRLYLKS